MKNNQFIQIFYNFFDKKLSHLSPNAIAGYLHIRRRFNGRNNGSISFSCREMADCIGKKKSTAKYVFDELIDNELIEVSRGSSFDLKTKTARLWKIPNLKLKKKSVHSNKHSVQMNKHHVQKN
tara:strand:- start:740 stop:1108 length:369 start_codon:yes stop_codon:yes gene_type:complete